ncbi:hypothetical protein QQ045_016641 [Rhodiola kirilowii]
MVINQLWAMSKEEDSLWKLWTAAYWTKGRNWWEMEDNNNNSWVTKRLECCNKLSDKCVAIENNRVKWIGQVL